MPAASKKSLYQRLCLMQAELASTGIAKDDENKFDKYKYRGIDSVLNTIGPMLARHELLLMPSVQWMEITPCISSQGKPQNHAKVLVDFTFYDTSGESLTRRFAGEAMDRGDKALNKAETAAFKYFLFECFCIPLHGEEGDADNESPEVGAPQIPAPQIPVAPQPSTTAPPQDNVATLHPVNQTASEAGDNTIVIIDAEGAENAVNLLTSMIGMHSNDRNALTGFWRENKQVIDILDTSYPEQYQRIKAAFTAASDQLTAPTTQETTS
jgi:hypothetical protein